MASNAKGILFPVPPHEDKDVRTVRKALLNVVETALNARRTILRIAKRRGMGVISSSLTEDQRAIGLAIMEATKVLITTVGEVDPGDPPDSPEPVVPDLGP